MRRLVLFVAVALLLSSVALGDGGPNHQVKQTLPVKMGASGGSVNDRSNAFCCGGTLGSAVTRDGVLSILSNNHILARSGLATAGEDTLQPGLIDTGCNGANSNIVGDFAGDIVPLGTANVDAAISTARSGAVDTTGAILDVGVPCSATQGAILGLPVMKSGRTTGFTTSTVQSFNATVSVQYQKGCGKGRKFTITYTNQILTGNMSAGGDSGSLLLSNDGTPNPVGLLYAGSSSVTVHNPIQDVVNAFSAGGHTFGFVGTMCTSSASLPIVAGPPSSEVEFATMVKERHERDLMAQPAILGVGVGADDQNPNEAVIVVLLEEGRSHRPIPAELDGVRVRVIRTDPIVAQ
jgi:hypothetical protein